MKVKEFIENKNSVDVVTTHYMPVMKKQEMCREVLGNCLENIDGFITIDHTKCKVLLTMNALQYYTNLKCSKKFESIVKDYDLLCDSNRMNVILTEIGADFNELYDIYLQESDAILKKNSIEAQVAYVVNGLINAVDFLADKAGDFIENFNISDIIFKDTDIGELIEFAQKYK